MCVDSGFRASLGGRHHWGFGWQAGVFLYLAQRAIGTFCGKRTTNGPTPVFLRKRSVTESLLSKLGAQTMERGEVLHSSR